MPPHHQHTILIIQYGHHRGAGHAQHVLLEPHAVRQLNVGDAQPRPARVVYDPLAMDSPARQLGSPFVGHKDDGIRQFERQPEL